MEIKCAFKEMVPIVKLVEHPRNPNKHPEKQVKMLAKIIKYHGWRHPIIVSKRSGFVVAGHGRLMAARELGLEEVPVDYQEFESEAAEFQFLVADNKIAELAEHDDLKMVAEIKDLGLVDLDFEFLGIENLSLETLEIAKESEAEFTEWEERYSDGEYITIKMIFEKELWESKQEKIKSLINDYKCESLSNLFLHLLDEKN
jgi:hypothetical protein